MNATTNLELKEHLDNLLVSMIKRGTKTLTTKEWRVAQLIGMAQEMCADAIEEDRIRDSEFLDDKVAL